MEGTLWKWTNYFSGWQPRWFILDNGILSYYKSQDDVNNGCKGSIKMAVCDVNVHPTDTTRLDLIIPGEAHFYVKSATAQERQQWLVALGSCKACLTTTGRPAAESDEVISTDQLKVKKSELRLYCDLLMQQVHSVKSAVTEETAPDVEKLNDATSLLKATCDTFIRTLEDCMKIANAKATYESVSKSPIQRSQSADKYLSSAATTLNQESNVRSGKFGSQRSHSDSAAVNGHLSEEYFYENYHVEIEKKNSENYDSANYDSDSSPKNKDSSNNVFQNDAIESKKYPTFFNTMSASFADVILQEDSKIPVQPFLDACRSILPIFDKLGSTAFAPVKMDISGNVKKIHQKYITNPELFQTLQDIMVYEVKAQHHHVSNSATTAILWLKRALEFISEFIAEVAEGKPDLAECANNAYSKTLRPYHGWVVRGVFGVAMRSLPYRKDFLLHLAMSEEDFEQPDFIEQLTKNMQDYSTAEDKILHVLQDYLHAHNLNSDAEV